MLFVLLFTGFLAGHALATVDGALSGAVLDGQGIAVANAKVTITGNGIEKDLISSATGTFQVFPLAIGDYQVNVQADGFSPYQGTVAVSGSSSSLEVRLSPAGEIQMTVKAKRHLVTPAPESSKELDQEDIQELPGGSTTSLPHLLYTTNPGMVEGSFNQVFTRGNHANLQYQIDGIQLPDSVAGSLGEAFTPLNIDHMEVITGGLQPEFGTRSAGVVNIVTKAGTTEPGGLFGIDYGSYNQTSPFLTYGGSDASGAFHYFFSGSGFYTDRGLDTPEPATTNLPQGSDVDATGGGGEQVVHDQSYGDGEFTKLDWILDNENKLYFVAFNEQKFYQIPNYPANFTPNLLYFNPAYTDGYGNGPFAYAPSSTNDTQFETNQYAEFSWRHSFGDDAFLQVSPYWKRSNVTFNGDPANDLAAASLVPLSAGQTLVADSFSQDRTSNNVGLQADYTLHADSANLVKAGFQGLWTQSSGPVSVIDVTAVGGSSPITASSGLPSTDVDNGYQEGFYLQDDLNVNSWLVLSGGLRMDLYQFVDTEDGVNDSYDLLQPRIGASFLASNNTKFHIFYGKQFMPAPPEDLRATFENLGGTIAPYDIKPEIDDYFETGMAQQVSQQLLSLNTYLKLATNMLDDTQLLNTAIAQPYNFAQGYAYGVEFSVNGKIDNQWSDYFNYSYEIAKGEGISGGFFAFAPGTTPPNVYEFLDHCQIHTANVGLTYNPGDIWITGEGLFGGGLSTGPTDNERLPAHATMDATIGYAFQKNSGFDGTKLSFDVMNIFDDPYVIFLDNGYNGNHYEAGREYIFHLEEKL